MEVFTLKIEFENEQEKECLKHILLDWLMHNGDTDVLGCEPACRNPSSPGCSHCVEELIDFQLNKLSKLKFWAFGGEEWLMKQKIDNLLKELKLIEKK